MNAFRFVLVACACAMVHAYVRMHRPEELETLKSSHTVRRCG